MIMRGWEQVEALREVRAAMPAEIAIRFKRYVTKTIYRSRYGAGGQLRKETALPNNYLDMVQRAV